MPASTPPAGSQPTTVPRKPRDTEVDMFGITHPGKVRKQNQDHFLVCMLHKIMRVRSTSLPNPEILEMPSERLASVLMVADGVGGAAAGEAASRSALEMLASYVTNTMQCYFAADPKDGTTEFVETLQAAANECHQAVVERARSEPDLKGMATTLTLGIVAWPKLYVLQVGDSRCYLFRKGELTQLTRDQTMAQDLVDSGAVEPERVRNSPLANVLSSAIGGTTLPVVTQHPLAHGDVLLFCTDGLTRHVPDERIRERLAALESSEQACRVLLQDALDGGGRDNITVVVGRNVVKD